MSEENDELYMLWTDTAPPQESVLKAIKHFKERYGHIPVTIEIPKGCSINVDVHWRIGDIPKGHIYLGFVSQMEADSRGKKKDDDNEL